jgi:amidase
MLDATAQAELVRRREVTPLDLVDAAIARIEKLNPAVNAVITPTFERARDRARSAKLPDGPFRGVPFLMKDLDNCTADEPFHCGMRLLRETGYKADHDSYLAERFTAAGLVSLGKTNTPELGLTITTEPEAYGPSRNPWNLGHSTGGSSGGSAAAVACGMVPAAHASDGGGSIRIPASECGLVGLKPSRGRVSLGPDYTEYWDGLVISHVVTRSVRDCAAILDTVSVPFPGDPYVAPAPQRPFLQEVTARPATLRIGVMARIPQGAAGELDPDCKAAVEVAAKLCERLGHRVEYAHPKALDWFEETTTHFANIVTAWTAAGLDEWSKATGRPITEQTVEHTTWGLAALGRELSAADYVTTVKWVGRYMREMAAWWTGGFDVLVTPTIAEPPPPLGALIPKRGDMGEATRRVLRLMPFTPPFNMTGQPAVSLPLHWNAAGLPIGVQFVAAYGREDILLGLAGQLEQASPWAQKWPAVRA